MDFEGAKQDAIRDAQARATSALHTMSDSLAHPRAKDTCATFVPARIANLAHAASTMNLGTRLCQLYFVAVLVGALAYALVTPPAEFSYDFSLIHGFVLAALSSVCIWLFQKRASSARVMGILAAAAIAVVSIADMFLMGAFTVASARIGIVSVASVLGVLYATSVVVALYLALSPRVLETLSEPLDVRPIAREGYSFDTPLKQRARTWVFWRDLLMYFFVFSFAGHWAEMLFCYNIHLGVFMGDVDFSGVMLWKQWLFPYCAEGVAVVLIAVLLTPVKEWLLRRFNGRLLPAVLMSIVVTAVVCTTIDFTCGMICNQNYEVWDYRALPFNFMGQVCLQNSTVYTVAAALILWVFYPLMDRGLRRMPRCASDALFFALAGIYAFSALLHFMFVGDAGLVVGAFEM